MDVQGKTAVVTGAASGIGRALSRRFVAEGAGKVVLADLDGDGAQRVADELGDAAVALTLDVAADDQVDGLIDDVESRWGPIDLFCSNAGVFTRGGLETPAETWSRMTDVNLWSHLYVARSLVPRMVERGGGYLLFTASAAGLLSQIGSLTYTVTKHACVALAEWIAITHGGQGIGVSVLCPQAVRTAMLTGDGSVAAVDGVMEPEDVAQAVVEGLVAEDFLILPHPEVAEYVRRKGEDRDRWLAGMRRLQSRFDLD